MKNLLLSSFLLFGSLIFVSCKKDNGPSQEKEMSAKNNSGVSVSSRGYLKFATTNDIVVFSKKLLNPATRETTISELNDKGFKNRKSNIASRDYDPNNPYDLIFNKDGVLEIENVIIKITDDDKFIFTLKEEFANEENFNKLINMVYDELIMNKLNVERNINEEFNLMSFIVQFPNGINEALNNTESKRPMFGSTSTDCQIFSYGPCMWEECTVNHYFFWILVSTQEHHETPGSRACD